MDLLSTYSLKLYDRKLADISLDRLAEYLKDFAHVLGKDNHPIFSSIDEGSILLRAKVPSSKVSTIDKRLLDAQSGDTQSGLSKVLIKMENMMSEDGISKAEFINHDQHVVVALLAANDEATAHWVTQVGEVDGEIVGVIGADDTMHVTVKEWGGRIVRLVAQVELGRDLGHHLRMGTVRLHVHGRWNRTENGWKPDPKRCFISRFEMLDESSAIHILNELRAIPGNGWRSEPNPMALWQELRGIEAQGSESQH